MTEIMRFTFEGRPLEFQKVNGEWWTNFREAADTIGYRSTKGVERVFGRHRDEFLASETTTVKMTAVDGKLREVRLFSPKGLEHLAILGRTETCRRFRRWLLDEVLERLRDGARLVTPEQLARGLATVEARYQKQIEMLMTALTDMGRQNLALAGAVSVQASSAGKLLSYIAHSPDARRAIGDARDAASGQNRLPFDFGSGNLTETGGAV